VGPAAAGVETKHSLIGNGTNVTGKAGGRIGPVAQYRKKELFQSKPSSEFEPVTIPQ